MNLKDPSLFHLIDQEWRTYRTRAIIGTWQNIFETSLTEVSKSKYSKILQNIRI